MKRRPPGPAVPQHYLLEVAKSNTQQRWLGEEVQVEAAEEEVAVEMAPVVGVTEVVEVLAIEPDQLRLGSRRSWRATYLISESDRLPI